MGSGSCLFIVSSGSWAVEGEALGKWWHRTAGQGRAEAAGHWYGLEGGLVWVGAVVAGVLYRLVVTRCGLLRRAFQWAFPCVS